MWGFLKIKSSNDCAELFTIKEFFHLLNKGELTENDGKGYFGFESERPDQDVPTEPMWFVFGAKKLYSRMVV